MNFIMSGDMSGDIIIVYSTYLLAGNPGLVIAGSGRSADVLAEAYKLSTPEEAFNNDG